MDGPELFGGISACATKLCSRCQQIDCSGYSGSNLSRIDKIHKKIQDNHRSPFSLNTAGFFNYGNSAAWSFKFLLTPIRIRVARSQNVAAAIRNLIFQRGTGAGGHRPPSNSWCRRVVSLIRPLQKKFIRQLQKKMPAHIRFPARENR